MPTERLVIEINEKGATVVSRNLKDIGKTSQKSAKGVNILGRALGALAVGATVKQLVSIADEFTNIQNRLRTVTRTSAELETVTDRLFRIANKTRSEFGATAEVYTRVALAAKDLGISQQTTLDFTESLNQAVILSGASATEAQAGLLQLSQGLASGTLRGDELRSVLEQLPVVADVIAKELGVTRGGLRALGEQGKISAEIVLEAFKNARTELQEGFGKTVPTVGQAFTVLKNNFVRLVGEFGKASGISSGLARAILFISENLGKLKTGLDAIVDIGAVVFEEISKALEPIAPAFVKIGEVGQEVAKNLGLYWLALLRTVAQVVDTIAKLFGKLFKFLNDNFGTVFEAIGGIILDFVNIAIGLVQGLVQGFIVAINQVRKFLGQSLIEEFDLVQINNAQNILLQGKKLGNQLVEGLQSSDLTGFVDTVIDKAQNRIAARAATPTGGGADLTGVTGGGPTVSPGQTAANIEQGLLASLRQEGQLLRLTNSERDVQVQLLQLEAQFKKQLTDATDEQVAGFLKEAENLIRSNQELQTQADLLEEIKGPQREFEQTLAALNALYIDGRISIEEYEKAFSSLTQTSKDDVSVFSDIGNTIGETLFDNATRALNDFQSTWKDFVQGFLQDLARIAAQKAILAAFGGIGIPGFQSGGSFQVGGSGGPDSKLVSFMATPGERVDITQPGRQAPPTGGASGSITIVNVSDPSEVAQFMASREGEQVIMNVISRNKSTVRQAIA